MDSFENLEAFTRGELQESFNLPDANISFPDDLPKDFFLGELSDGDDGNEADAEETEKEVRNIRFK